MCEMEFSHDKVECHIKSFLALRVCAGQCGVFFWSLGFSDQRGGEIVFSAGRRKFGVRL